MYSIYDQPLHVQAMKVKVADLLKEYQEIKARRIYHKIAYRYEIDSMIDKVANYFDEAAKIGEAALEFIQTKGLANLDNLPPIITERISEIVKAFEEDNPDISAADKMALIGALFTEGGELDGLVNPDNTINKEWLEKYLSDPSHIPDYYSDVSLTPEMEADMQAIAKRQDLTKEEQEDLFSSYFHKGGKYEGYIQKDGTVDVAKIAKKS